MLTKVNFIANIGTMRKNKYIILNVIFALYYVVFAVSPLEYANAAEPAASSISSNAGEKGRPAASFKLFVVDLVLSNVAHHDNDGGKTRLLFKKKRAYSQPAFETSKARIVLPRALPRALPPNGSDVADDPERTGVTEDLTDPPEVRYTVAAEETKPKADRGFKQDHSGLSPPIA